MQHCNTTFYRVWWVFMESCIKNHVELFFIPWVHLFSVSHLHVTLSISLPRYVRFLYILLNLHSTLYLRIQRLFVKALRIQLDNPSLLVKSLKFSLVNGFWSNEFNVWPSSTFSFDWLELFCLIHSVSHCSLLGICLNAIQCLSKCLFLTACNSLIIAFAFTSCLEQAARCWKVLCHVYYHFFSYTCNPSSYIHSWVYMPSFLSLFCTLYDQIKDLIHIMEFAFESVSAVRMVTFLIRHLYLSLSNWD